ncbi:hypothetical protein J3E64_001379 [Sphingobium sp. OAS761]|uniref:hypothetical protein n=1 Tax=Sphingobium sp. OAS761 TaxID=2817901 RepID=UPI00209F7F48|nr:hypothetical protein [Sphingobium sp. OAS761]MCP1469697.1 hypothetical protein [Sphingobium sp. OAS761]
MFLAVTLISMASYLMLGPWLLYRQQFLVGALSMCLAAAAPLFAQVALTDSDMPGTALLMMIMLPLPVLIFMGRILFLMVRAVRQTFQNWGQVA